ncbi:LPXTG cell wall anchor domain-containing protein [Wenjunlia tyrosinilytica]|uniref:Gram-positive cocci surface proteins LPxTG domain-containing protein n=1 Tax=Wenjunlia tyrosinilytica TaxID=1544741 RepID=A0A917ZED5_9ACTN|nr:LPXTG cell wall anchor domain-containing protein [Wenjunlia tyrosinilytica]GGO80962.1 hypothetical protein GCM10012280_04110 [Wenjunlia tyrosinilytica]
MPRRTHTSIAVAAATAMSGFLVLPAHAATSAAGADEGVPDLAVSALVDADVKLGSTQVNRFTVTNHGTAAADGLVVRIRTTPGLKYTERLEGCKYSRVKEPQDHMVDEALCTIDTVLAPGRSYDFAPVGVKVEPNALMELFDVDARAEGDPREPDPNDNHRRQRLDADSSADLLAVGDSAKGRPGDTVGVTAKLRNQGPGWVGISGTDDQPALMVVVPKGTTAVEVPKDCYPWNIDGPGGPSAPGKPQYICAALPRFMEAGSTYPFPFELKIGKGAEDTRAKVWATTVYGGKLAFDKNHANDQAFLSVDVRGSGGTGGSSGGDGGNDPHPQTTGGDSSGGSGSSGSSASGSSGSSASGSTGGSASASGTSSGSSSGSSSSGGSGGLAHTGSSGMPLIAGIAAAATALGGGTLFAVRRRRKGSDS